MKRRIVAIDIDDVIAAGTDSFRRRINETMGINLTESHYSVPGDYWGYYERVWEINGINQADVPRAKIDAEMEIDQSHVPLLPGASFAVAQLAKRFDIAIVTACNLNWENATLAWLTSHFGEVFIDVHFAGNSSGKASKSKGQLCREVGAEWLIDDNPEHCMSAIKEGLQPILFGEYGWHHDAPPDLRKCNNWPAVLEYFDAFR